MEMAADTAVEGKFRSGFVPCKHGKAAPKYRGPGGHIWFGRGLTSVWVREAIKKGKKKEGFLIAKKSVRQCSGLAAV
jgi:DNA-binding protein H-NS